MLSSIFQPIRRRLPRSRTLERQRHPSWSDVGDVAHQGNIRLSGSKAPFDEVGKWLGILGSDRRANPSALGDADELVEAHQAFHALVVDGATAAAQPSGDAWAPIAVVRASVDLTDLAEQLALGQLGRRSGRWPSARGSWRPRWPPLCTLSAPENLWHSWRRREIAAHRSDVLSND
jgi:hypothetical protein